MEVAFPPLGFSGLPVRFSWLATFGLSVAVGFGFAKMCGRGRLGRALAVVLAAMAVLECWPRHFETSSWPAPEIVTDWARDKGEWAVLDGTSLSRALWHQMHHRHPIVAGYATRFPERVLRALEASPGVQEFLPAPFGGAQNVEASVKTTVEDLRKLRIRFVILNEGQTKNAVLLGLIERYRGDGIVAYEVPSG
jgi:hypothetical protein